MDATEKWGDDVDSAVELALTELELTRDQVDVEVLEQPSRGFFGIGSKLAHVRVSKKKPAVPAEPEEKPASDREPERTDTEESAPEEAYTAPAADPEAETDTTAEVSGDAGNTVPEERTERRNPRKSRRRPDRKQGRGDRRDRRSRGHSESSGTEYVSKLPELDFHHEMDQLPDAPDHPAKKFLEDVIAKMGVDLSVVCKADESNVLIEISGPDTRTVIGKRGQTLDALQYLTSLVVNKDHKDYIRVVVDAENYRSRREKTLEQLADRLARKVVRTGRSVKLEPMNPYERKVIHSTLQSNPDVTTRSEGQDPYRRVVIELK